MVPRRGMLVAGVAVAALAIGTAGCGSGGDDTAAGETEAAATTSTAPEPPAPPTKAEYIEAADEVCDRFNKKQAVFEDRTELTQAVIDAGTNEGATEVGKAVEAVADQRQDLTDALLELEPPSSGRPQDYFDQRKKTIAITHDLADAWADYGAGKTDATPVNEQSEAEIAAIEKSTELAEDYGFKSCSKPVKVK